MNRISIALIAAVALGACKSTSADTTGVSGEGATAEVAATPQDVDGTRARQLVESGALLVDVRTPAEFADRHLPGAINVPVQELAGRLSELEPKTRPVVLYCRSGNRSGHAAAQLASAGFAEIYDLGAINSW